MLEKIDTFKINPGRFLIDTYKKGDITITANNVFVPELIYLSEDFDSLSTLGNFNNGTVNASTGRMELWQTLLKFDNTNNYYLEEVLKGSTQKKRNIFIGSFNHSHEDVHKTAYGDIDGGLIMLNIYYNLLMNENSLHKGYIAFIILGFMLISYLMLYHPKPPFHFKSPVLNTITEIIVDELHYIILVTMTFLSSYWFDKAANLVAMVIVVFVLSKIIQIVQAKKGKQPSATHN